MKSLKDLLPLNLKSAERDSFDLDVQHLQIEPRLPAYQETEPDFFFFCLFFVQEVYYCFMSLQLEPTLVCKIKRDSCTIKHFHMDCL